MIISVGVISTAAMKTQGFANIWKAALAPFAPSNYTPVIQFFGDGILYFI